MDVIELDAASHTGVDHIRSLIDEAVFAPTQGRWKIYIIDEAHMLSKAANNAFLKTLEEPPPHVIFILATTEPQKILPTIHSRCQCFQFRRISPADIVERLRHVVERENLERATPVEADLDGLALIARHATGSMRDALSVLEQVLSFCDTRLTLADVRMVLGRVAGEVLREFLTAVADRNVPAGLTLIDRISDEGIHFPDFFSELIAVLRDLLLVKSGVTDEEILSCGREHINELQELAARFRSEALLSLLSTASRALADLRGATDLKLHAELTMIASVSALQQMEETTINRFLTEDFLDRLIHLETKVEFLLNGGGSQTARRPGTEPIRRPATTLPPAPVTPSATPPVKPAAPVAKPEPAPRVVPEADSEPGVLTRPAPELPAGDVTLASVTGMWDYILEKVKERKAQTHAMLCEGRPRSLENGRLLITFEPRFDWHVKQLQDAKRRNDIELTLFELLKQRITVQAEIEGAPEQTSAMETISGRPDLVERVLDLFGGTIEPPGH